MAITTREVERRLTQRGWFGNQPGSLRRDILSLAQWRKYADGELVLCESDSAPALYAVVDGCIHYSHLSNTGDEHLAKILHAGDWFNYIVFLDGTVLPFIARSSGASHVLRLSEKAFNTITAAKPEYHRNFAQIIGVNMHHTSLRLLNIFINSPEQRLAGLLLEFDAIGEEIAHYNALHITQGEICQLLGLSRSKTGEILRDWNRRGWIALHYSGLKILDKSQLENIING